MNGPNIAARVSLIALSAMLAACGGGGSGGVASTPTPTPAPVTYTKIADMSGNRTFQTAGVTFTPAVSGFTNTSTQAFGSGSTVKYDAASDTYTLTSPFGDTASFNPPSAQPSTTPGLQQWQSVNGFNRDTFTLFVPSSPSGVTLSYTVLGTWQTLNSGNGTSTVRLSLGGAPTVASDMPRTGSATYATSVYGNAISNGLAYNLNADTKATFSADFANGKVTSTLDLAGRPAPTAAAVGFGTFTGNGTITSGGPGFSGTMTGANATGAFSGAFFGPSALEMAYTLYLTGGVLNVGASVVGVKQ